MSETKFLSLRDLVLIHGAWKQFYAKIDDGARQNPAYRLALYESERFLPL